MKKSLLVVFFVLQAACAGVAPDHLVDAQAGPVASAEDFRVVAGSGWNGHLSYLDYSNEKIKFSRDGRKLNGGLIVTRKQNDNGDLTLVTTYQGQDDNRRADIRVTYAIGSMAFSISKEVRLEGESDYFIRSQYSLVR